MAAINSGNNYRIHCIENDNYYLCTGTDSTDVLMLISGVSVALDIQIGDETRTL